MARFFFREMVFRVGSSDQQKRCRGTPPLGFRVFAVVPSVEFVRFGSVRRPFLKVRFGLFFFCSVRHKVRFGAFFFCSVKSMVRFGSVRWKRGSVDLYPILPPCQYPGGETGHPYLRALKRTGLNCPALPFSRAAYRPTHQPGPPSK